MSRRAPAPLAISPPTRWRKRPATAGVRGGRRGYFCAGRPAGRPPPRGGGAGAPGGRRRADFGGPPEVPTIAEEGLPDYEATLGQGFFAPASLPADMATRIAAD